MPLEFPEWGRICKAMDKIRGGGRAIELVGPPRVGKRTIAIRYCVRAKLRPVEIEPRDSPRHFEENEIGLVLGTERWGTDLRRLGGQDRLILTSFVRAVPWARQVICNPSPLHEAAVALQLDPAIPGVQALLELTAGYPHPLTTIWTQLDRARDPVGRVQLLLESCGRSGTLETLGPDEWHSALQMRINTLEFRVLEVLALFRGLSRAALLALAEYIWPQGNGPQHVSGCLRDLRAEGLVLEGECLASEPDRMHVHPLVANLLRHRTTQADDIRRLLPGLEESFPGITSEFLGKLSPVPSGF